MPQSHVQATTEASEVHSEADKAVGQPTSLSPTGPAGNASGPGWLSSGKDLLAAVQSLFAIGALIAAGWWFLAGRQDKTRIRIEESVSHRPDSSDAGYNIVVVDVRVTNTANVVVEIDPKDGEIDIDEVSTPSKSLLVEQVGGFRVEPNETEQVFFQTFRLPSHIKTIQVYSVFQTHEKAFYWHLAGAFDVADTDHETQKSTSEETPQTTQRTSLPAPPGKQMK
jgi:hypothetical protein